MFNFTFPPFLSASFAEAALSGDEWESEFKVYPLKKLLFELGKLYVPKTMIDMDIAEIILDKDPYMYQDGIACPVSKKKIFLPLDS